MTSDIYIYIYIYIYICVYTYIYTYYAYIYIYIHVYISQPRQGDSVCDRKEKTNGFELPRSLPSAEGEMFARPSTCRALACTCSCFCSQRPRAFEACGASFEGWACHSCFLNLFGLSRHLPAQTEGTWQGEGRVFSAGVPSDHSEPKPPLP